MTKVTKISLAALLIGTAGMTQAQTIDEVCKAAESEPPLMWYSSQDPNFNTNVVNAFVKAYPNIRTEHFRLPSGALAARFGSERDAGVVNADLLSLADPKFVVAARDKGWLIDFPKSDLPAMSELVDEYFDKGVAKVGVNVSGMTYNTELVGEPLTDWTDLLRPEFKGRIAVADPRNVPSFMAHFQILRDTYGPEFLEKLGAQELVAVASAVPGTQQVAAGEYIIVFPNATAVSEPVKQQGAPVDTFIPNMTSGIEYYTMQPSGADSPNAAKCLFNFLYTDDGQRMFNGSTSVPIYPNMDGMKSLPPNYVTPKILALTSETEAEIIKLLDLH